MSADQIAEIAPFGREVFAAHQEPRSSTGVELCANLEIAGMPQAWLQVTVNTLNFAYPSEESPEVMLRSILASLPAGEVQDWVPLKFATIGFAPIDPRVLAHVIDTLFTRLFNPGDYAIDGTLERLPSTHA